MWGWDGVEVEGGSAMSFHKLIMQEKQIFAVFGVELDRLVFSAGVHNMLRALMKLDRTGYIYNSLPQKLIVARARACVYVCVCVCVVRACVCARA